ncbi:MAG TPA: EF-P beta-lysylation protein EpmB [Oceanospirillaceae bacterium]|nr:EF-P beta-lysylation protein EpmB [Oceanospirillaceae bacterium]
MIPQSTAQVEPLSLIKHIQHSDDWRTQLRTAYRSPGQLLAALDFNRQQILTMTASDQGFNTLVPHAFVEKMAKQDANDPLLLQVLPQAAEAIAHPDFNTDPLQEASFNPQPGVVHKYKGRALLITAGHCAINCRYCFRRHYPYGEQRRARSEWQQSLAYIQQQTDIEEVILSGGDPLALTDSQLFEIITAIESITHIKRLRIHSRLPIVLPARITPELCQRLANSRLTCVIVVHANHANELGEDVAQACNLLRQHGVQLLNQSVLLAQVNDSLAALKDLSERLFELGVLPYYLHLPDHVAGTTHFFVSLERGQALVAQMQATMSGYLVPKLAREEPGKTSKTVYAKA